MLTAQNGAEPLGGNQTEAKASRISFFVQSALSLRR
jgi:hypothetical protein